METKVAEDDELPVLEKYLPLYDILIWNPYTAKWGIYRRIVNPDFNPNKG